MTNSKFNTVYLEKIYNLISAFKDRFIDFQKVKMLLDLFSNAFAILPENAPESANLNLSTCKMMRTYSINLMKIIY